MMQDISVSAVQRRVALTGDWYLRLIIRAGLLGLGAITAIILMHAERPFPEADMAVPAAAAASLGSASLNRAQVIPRRSLHTEIADRLRDLIVEGSLKPGEKVHEAALCVAFGVSRTPLREAVKALAAEGLISLTPNRGATIATITPHEIVELFPIMGALEALAGELAAKAVTDAQLAELQRHHEMLVSAHERGSWTTYIKANRAFHDGLIKIAGNESLTLLHRQLLARTHAIRFVARPSDECWREAVSDHVKIMAALTTRNGHKLGKLLASHVRHKAEAILNVLGA